MYGIGEKGVRLLREEMKRRAGLDREAWGIPKILAVG